MGTPLNEAYQIAKPKNAKTSSNKYCVRETQEKLLSEFEKAQYSFVPQNYITKAESIMSVELGNPVVLNKLKSFDQTNVSKYVETLILKDIQTPSPQQVHKPSPSPQQVHKPSPSPQQVHKPSPSPQNVEAFQNEKMDESFKIISLIFLCFIILKLFDCL
tara:strand:- start:4913 stop:5392 length:480 start_codon:yes stop_codon:yes gene_type:complete